MKNFIQPGNTITLAAPAAVTSGSGVLVDAIFGIAAHDAASGDSLETVTTGVFDLNKIGSQAWGLGDKVYWDNTNKRVTKIATDDTFIGVAIGTVGSGADETIGRVRLNGSF
jgi:predicted RecA/RadA family phage recombinase